MVPNQRKRFIKLGIFDRVWIWERNLCSLIIKDTRLPSRPHTALFFNLSPKVYCACVLVCLWQQNKKNQSQMKIYLIGWFFFIKCIISKSFNDEIVSSSKHIQNKVGFIIVFFCLTFIQFIFHLKVYELLKKILKKIIINHLI